MRINLTRWTACAVYARYYESEARKVALAEVHLMARHHWEAVDSVTGEVICERRGENARLQCMDAVERHFEKKELAL